jgi:hypothetical protein
MAVSSMGQLIPIGLQTVNAPAKDAPSAISGQIRRTVHC